MMSRGRQKRGRVEDPLLLNRNRHIYVIVVAVVVVLLLVVLLVGCRGTARRGRGPRGDVYRPAAGRG